MDKFTIEYDKEEFEEKYKDKIKQYIKRKLSESTIKNNIFEFDIEDFLRNFPEACEVNDIILEYPIEVEKTLLDIFKETYKEVFGEDSRTEKELEKICISLKNPIGCEKKIENINSFDINKLLTFEGDIISAGKVCALLKVARFVCPECGWNITHTTYNYFEKIPKYICKVCEKNDRRVEMELDLD
ncbi:MAG TPA: minichromosome maintenance protein MCM, partial [Methanothermococcus okinawensis]|nr:minichromosome maintenance protein MCM [Methanothermococcus okinawensis]